MNSRAHFAAGTVAAVAALGFVYWLQYVGGLEPCPLCIFQRIAVAGFGLVCAIGWLHGPRGPGRRVYAAAAAVVALAGALLAARQVWIMHLPADQVPACGPSLHYLIRILPWRQVVATVLRGDASCATVKGAFAGLSLPEWSLLYFCVLCVAALVWAFGRVASPADKARHARAPSVNS